MIIIVYLWEQVYMSNSQKTLDTLCPVARAEEVLGGRWTLLVLRELFMGNHRFDDIQIQTGGTPQMITGRLKSLEAEGLISREPYSQRPLRYEYRLTPKGDAFYPVILALREWGETWCKSEDEDVAVRYTHLTCGHDAGIGTVCEACGEPLRREDLKAELSPSYAQERAARQEAAKT